MVSTAEGCVRQKKKLKTFLDLTTSYSIFVPNLSHKLQSLHDLLKKTKIFTWSKHQEKCFNNIKMEMAMDTLLALFEPNKKLIHPTDISNYQIFLNQQGSFKHLWGNL